MDSGVDEEEEEGATNGDTASFELQRNVQLDLRKIQLPITAVLDCNGVRFDSEAQKLLLQGSPERKWLHDDKEEEDSMLYFEQVIQSKKNASNSQHDYDEAAQRDREDH